MNIDVALIKRIKDNLDIIRMTQVDSFQIGKCCREFYRCIFSGMDDMCLKVEYKDKLFIAIIGSEHINQDVFAENLIVKICNEIVSTAFRYTTSTKLHEYALRFKQAKSTVEIRSFTQEASHAASGFGGVEESDIAFSAANFIDKSVNAFSSKVAVSYLSSTFGIFTQPTRDAVIVKAVALCIDILNEMGSLGTMTQDKAEPVRSRNIEI